MLPLFDDAAFGDVAPLVLLAFATIPLLASILCIARREGSAWAKRVILPILALLVAAGPPAPPAALLCAAGLLALALPGTRRREVSRLRHGHFARPRAAATTRIAMGRLALAPAALAILILGGSNWSTATAHTAATFPPEPSVTPVISAGKGHNLALKADGTLWAWGENTHGKLGTGRTPGQAAAYPERVRGLGTVTLIEAGVHHSMAVQADGTLWAWGSNSYGQLGNDTTTNSTTPVQVSNLSGVTALASGWGWSMALKSDGTVWAWGYNNSGQLGDGTRITRSTPAQVGGLPLPATAIAAGEYHALALLSDGSVYAWGWNSYGQVGPKRPGITYELTPLAVPNLSGATSVATGDKHSLAIVSGGVVWSWGDNASGQAGRGSIGGSAIAPGAIADLSNVVEVVGGDGYSVALKGDGSVWAWGRNEQGQVGNGTTTNRATPVQVSGPVSLGGTFGGVSQISSGPKSWHSLAMRPDGSIWAWGFNLAGQLSGTGPDPCPFPPNATHARCSFTPVPVLGLTLRTEPYDMLHDCAPSTPWTTTAGLGVNAVCGTFQTTQTDLVVPGRGVPLDLTRTYHSADPTDVGFGPGWSFTYGMKLDFESSTTVIVRRADGRRDRYTKGATANGITDYTPPPGVYDTLKLYIANDTYKLMTVDWIDYDFRASDGKLLWIGNRIGALTSLQHTDTAITVTDPANRKFTLTYGTGSNRGHIVSLTETGVLNRQVNYGYDASGNLNSVTDVRNNPLTMTYEEPSRLKTIVNQESNVVVTNTYEQASDRVLEQADANKTANVLVTPDTEGRRNIAFDYGTPGQTKVTGRRIGPGGATYDTVYAYDANRRITSVTDPRPKTVSFEYDAANNLTCTTNERGGKTHYGYDTRGNVTTIIDPANTNASCQLKSGGAQTTITYTAWNDVDLYTDRRNYTTDYDYHANKTLFRITDALNNRTQFYNTTNGRDLERIFDPESRLQTFKYDTYGYVKEIPDPEDTVNRITKLQWDAGGRLSKRTDPLGNETVYAYNNANQVETITATPDKVNNPAEKLVTTYVYDKVGNQKSVKVKRTATETLETTSFYDPNGNLTTVAEGAPGPTKTTTYDYDAADRLRKVTIPDTVPQVTTYAYDPIGRITETVAPRPNATTNLVTTYAYTDGLGGGDQLKREVAMTDPSGRVTTHRYDARDWLEQISYPLKGNYGAFSVTYEYDAEGNRISMHDDSTAGGSTTSYVYTAINQLQSVSSQVPTTSQTRTVGYEYDRSGLRKKLTYPDGKTVSYEYHLASGRLETVKMDWNSKVFMYDYDNAGRLQVLNNPNDTWTYYGYDDASRLINVTNGNGQWTPPGATAGSPFPSFRMDPDGTMSEHIYTLDGAGWRTQVQERIGPYGTTSPPTSFDYDTLGRLTSATYPNGRQVAYEYTPNGNRELLTESFGGTTTVTDSDYDNAGRLKQITVGGQLVSAYTYDQDSQGGVGNGNVTNRADLVAQISDTFRYDGANRLREARVAASQGATQPTEYSYDGDGLRVRKVTAQVPTDYVYDVNRALPEVIDDSGAIYVYGHGLLAAVAKDVNNTEVYYHTDGLGSVRLLTDGLGAVQARYDLYDAFGTPAEQTGGVANDRQFTGQQYDTESGHYYLRARYYDPAAGRFLSPDPIGLAGGSNPYAYAGNSPANYADPSGATPALAAVGALFSPPVMLVMAVVAVQVYACSQSTNCQQSLERTGQGIGAGLAGFPGTVLDGWNSAGPAAYAGDSFASSGGMAGYTGDTGYMLAALRPQQKTLTVAYDASIERVRNRSRDVHRTHANQQLKADLDSDPEFRTRMESVAPGIYGAAAARRQPEGWVWHHKIRNGEMHLQLIPKVQNQGGTWSPFAHPGKKGGFANR